MSGFLIQFWHLKHSIWVQHKLRGEQAYSGITYQQELALEISVFLWLKDYFGDDNVPIEQGLLPWTKCWQYGDGNKGEPFVEHVPGQDAMATSKDKAKHVTAV